MYARNARERTRLKVPMPMCTPLSKCIFSSQSFHVRLFSKWTLCLCNKQVMLQASRWHARPTYPLISYWLSSYITQLWFVTRQSHVYHGIDDTRSRSTNCHTQSKLFGTVLCINEIQLEIWTQVLLEFQATLIQPALSG